jgi:signal transduction histidine kinase
VLLNVFSNLISNANRYTRNGEVTITVRVINKTAEFEEGFIAVTVNDTGMGIKPERLENIFKRGVSDKGSGLGLYICKTAIEAQGGNIFINSDYGKGTKVTFTIPLEDEE